MLILLWSTFFLIKIYTPPKALNSVSLVKLSLSDFISVLIDRNGGVSSFVSDY